MSDTLPDIVDRQLINRRRFVAMAVGTGAAVVASCGSDAGPATTSPTISPTAISPATIPASTMPPAAIPATTIPATTVPATTGPSTDFPRTIVHGLGEAVIQSKPIRIVATADRDQLDVLLAMGITPLQCGFSGDYEVSAPWIDPTLLDGIVHATMADPFEPNFELIASASPDLIVDAWADQRIFDGLAAIAPTIEIKAATSDSWESAQRMAGRAMGEDAAAESAIAATREVLAAQAERIREATAGLVVAVAFQTGDQLNMIPGTDIGARVVTELGVDVVATPDGASGLYSLELIPELLGAADVILSFDYGDVLTLESNDLFRNLPAAQAGRYVTVPTDVATACYQESTLSLRWAAEAVATALLTAAQGRGTTLG